MEYTPLIKQYFSIVNQYPGTIVLMRVGDFYETYGEIAVTTSKILGITLTRRAIGSLPSSHNLELSGFPYHAIDSYLPKLIQVGYKVAVCDQMEDPAKAKGLVKRAVTEVITPGLATQDSVLNNKKNNYLASIFWQNNEYGISFLDYSTGEFLTTQGDLACIQKLIDSFQPSEVIYSKEQEEYINKITCRKSNSGLPDWVFKEQNAVDLITKHFDAMSVRGFGLEMMPLAVIASGAILQYLKDTGHQNLDHINTISRIEQDKYVWLDKFTIKNLELVTPQHENGSTLLDIIDYTSTPMGGRMIRKWIILPLKNIDYIQKRQDYVAIFFDNVSYEQKIYNELKRILDLERILSKISLRRAVPKDLLALVLTFNSIKKIKDILFSISISDMVLYDCADVMDKISRIINDDPTQSDSIRRGVNNELDEYKTIKHDGERYLNDLLEREIRKTGIPSLKISYNKIYGYYFEVSNTHKDKIPLNWQRKQTLTTAERYTTDELKVFEDRIVNADNKISDIENKIFNDLVDEVLKCSKHILHNADVIAQLDCYISFSIAARKNKYIRPVITNADNIDIEKGRHPVIEKRLDETDFFVPNDVHLNNDSDQIMLITGPNMSGKSALLRQVALTVLMAQIGSYVPADKAEIGMVDKIFTRIGASDNLSVGESTFMMEMTETASIMHNISRKSLILMDEIGRGTSTYDGISIAWAIIEYLHNSVERPKIMFATHYHELSSLEDKLERLHNFHLSVKENNGKVLYVRKLESGSSEHSFGINVAKLSGMPNPIVRNAKKILQQLEASRGDSTVNVNDSVVYDDPGEKYYEAEKLVEIVDGINIDTMNPLEALIQLNAIKEQIQQFRSQNLNSELNDI